MSTLELSQSILEDFFNAQVPDWERGVFRLAWWGGKRTRSEYVCVTDGQVRIPDCPIEIDGEFMRQLRDLLATHLVDEHNVEPPAVVVFDVSRNGAAETTIETGNDRAMPINPAFVGDKDSYFSDYAPGEGEAFVRDPDSIDEAEPVIDVIDPVGADEINEIELAEFLSAGAHFFGTFVRSTNKPWSAGFLRASLGDGGVVRLEAVREDQAGLLAMDLAAPDMAEALAPLSELISNIVQIIAETGQPKPVIAALWVSSDGAYRWFFDAEDADRFHLDLDRRSDPRSLFSEVSARVSP